MTRCSRCRQAYNDRLVEQRIGELRAARDRTLALVQHLSQPQLDDRPFSNKWSVGEVLDHLYLFSRFLADDLRRLVELARAGKVARIQHTFSDVNVAPALVPKGLMPLFQVPLALTTRFIPAGVRRVLAASRVLRIQHPDVADPHRGRTAEELRRDLTDINETTICLIEENRDLDLSAMSNWHPLLGRNNVPQILAFIVAHEQRHQGQIQDLLDHLRASPTSDLPRQIEPEIENPNRSDTVNHA